MPSWLDDPGEDGDGVGSVSEPPAMLATALAENARTGGAVIPLWWMREDGSCACALGRAPQIHKDGRGIGKHPILGAWERMPAHSQADIAALWESYPHANVGVRTGRRWGRVVLDQDEEGALRRFFLEHRQAGVRTRTVRTGSGGLHLEFAVAQQGPALRNSVRGLGAGVDVRGDGGQVVAPGSISGKGAYSVIEDAPLAPLPDWIERLIVERATPEPKLGASSTGPQPTPSGRDHSAFVQAAVEGERARLQAMGQAATVGGVGYEGDPWERTCWIAADLLISLANSAWNDYTLERAYVDYFTAAPRDAGWGDREVDDKWASALHRAAGKWRPEPEGKGNELAGYVWDPATGELRVDQALAPQGAPSEAAGMPSVASVDQAASAPQEAQEPTAEGSGQPELDEAFLRAVATELRTLQVREKARELHLQSQQGAPPEVDQGSLADLLARPAPPVARVEGLLPADGRVTIIAKRKTGKTTLTMNLINSLLSGDAFLGRFAVRPLLPTQSVLMLNYEVSGHQIATWMSEHDVDRDRVFVVNMRGRVNMLSTDRDRRWLRDYALERNAGFAMIDPFGRAFDGENQDSNSEVGRWLSTKLDPWLIESQIPEAALPVHAGWSADRSRGASALEDWPDAMWTLSADETDGRRYFSAEGRDVWLEKSPLEYEPSTRTLSLVESGDVRESSIERWMRVLDDKKVNKNMSLRQVRVMLRGHGVSFSNADTSLSAAVKRRKEGPTAFSVSPNWMTEGDDGDDGE